MVVIETRSGLWREDFTRTDNWSDRVRFLLNRSPELEDSETFAFASCEFSVTDGPVACKASVTFDTERLVVPVRIKSYRTKQGHEIYQAPEPSDLVSFVMRLLFEPSAVSQEDKEEIMGNEPFFFEAMGY